MIKINYPNINLLTFDSVMTNNQGDRFQRFRQIGLLTTIPVILLVGPALGYFIGNYLDNKFNTSPWLMIFFMVIGAAASVKEIINILTKGSADDK